MMALRRHWVLPRARRLLSNRLVGAIITDKGQQMERWVEHYSDLYPRENTVSPAALDVIECLPTMDELESEPSVEEHSKAIDNLASGKAPDNDGIPPELIKHCKTTLLLPLHEVLCQCWQEGAVPPHMRDSRIITLYKNKGERNNCNNYRGMSGHTDTPPEAGGAYLPGVTMWFPS